MAGQTGACSRCRTFDAPPHDAAGIPEGIPSLNFYIDFWRIKRLMEHIKDCIAAPREAAPEIDIAENEPHAPPYHVRHRWTGRPVRAAEDPQELTAALAVLRASAIFRSCCSATAPTCWWPMRASAVVVCTSELDEVRVNEDKHRLCRGGRCSAAALPPPRTAFRSDRS